MRSTRPVLLDHGDPDAIYPHQPWIARLGAVLIHRCPVCLAGPMFRGVRELNEKCHRCGHHFLRRPDVVRFVANVVIAAAFIGLLLLFRRVWPLSSIAVTVVAAVFVELVLAPVIYRYACVFAAHGTVLTRTR